MKKTTILAIILGLLLLAVAGLIVKQTVLKKEYAGLKIKTIPSSNVFLDGKNVGRTPYEDKKLKAGEMVVKLVPDSAGTGLPEWERKIKLVGGTQTVVNWDFGESESVSSGEIMTLEKISDKNSASLMVTSAPDSSLVKINGEPKNFTPLALDKQSNGDKRVTVSSSGFNDREIDIKLLAGYRLLLNVKLAERAEGDVLSDASPTGEPTEGQTPTGAKSTPTPTPKSSSKLTPTSGPSTTPKPTGSTGTTLPKPYVTIKDTPTGFLRVRSEPSTQATELTRVDPGESFSLVDERVVSGSVWYQIIYQTGKEGWISGQYATKFE